MGERCTKVRGDGLSLRVCVACGLAMAVAALGQTDHLRWQRSILPPAAAPFAEACVVLDAATFSHAEPGLRDLRLYQDGVELPYAVEESFDRRALEADRALPDDRSLYEPAAGPAPVKDGAAVLEAPPHVPLERLRVLPQAAAPTGITVQDADKTAPAEVETVHARLAPRESVLPVTLGGNLQNGALLQIAVNEPAAVRESSAASGRIQSVLMEMRRRSLCYQPRSASMLTLFLGGRDEAAPQYEFARHFSTAAALPSAQLGPIVPNPAYRDDAAGTGLLQTRASRLRLALLLAVAAFLFSANRLLHARRWQWH